MKNLGQNRFWFLSAAMILGALLIVVFGYLIWTKTRESAPREPVQTEKSVPESPLPRMANLPEKKPIIKLPPPPSYPPDAPALEQARNSLRDGISADDAVALAKSLPDSPERADAAFLLLEYAADSGSAEAAMLVARYYDPTDDTPSGTIRKNPEIAYEWYKAALTGGREDVRQHISKLHQWVEAQAKQGSDDAQQLLKNWR